MTHHAGFQRNQRITCQMNSAWGYIKKTNTGCEILYHTAKSWLCPHMMLLHLLINLLYAIASGFRFDTLRNIPGIITFIVICVFVSFPIIYTFGESTTEESINGEKIPTWIDIRPNRLPGIPKNDWKKITKEFYALYDY